MAKKEYNILNILRGTSALLVLFYHFFIFFFAYQDIWSVYLQVEPLNLPVPFYLETLQDFPLDVGHLAVAYFFLISGFLIHGTLRRYDSLGLFLKHKVVRLWPTYATCFALGVLFLAGFNYVIERPFPFTADHVLACFFWVRDILHYPFIDGAVWVLEIQLKFYIFAILVWSVWKKDFLPKACFIAILLSCAVYGLFYVTQDNNYSWFYLVLLAQKNLKFFMLILLGSCVYASFTKEISKLKAFVLCALLVACFLSPLFTYSHYSKTISYLLGFVSFFAFIVLYARQTTTIGKISQPINWVSNISYPLYIGHVIPGYLIMYYTIEQGYNAYLGIAMALLCSFVIAAIVHKKVEVPTHS